MVALVAAILSFTNITYWAVNATLPPAMKYAGLDTAVAGGRYIRVSYYYDGFGRNITRISVVGFTGDPTNYTDALRICNRYGSTAVAARLSYRGVVGGQYVGYVRSFYVYFASHVAGPRGVGFLGGATFTQSGVVYIPPGRCAVLGVYVVVSPDLPPAAADGKTVLAEFQVDIVMEIVALDIDFTRVEVVSYSPYLRDVTYCCIENSVVGVVDGDPSVRFTFRNAYPGAWMVYRVTVYNDGDVAVNVNCEGVAVPEFSMEISPSVIENLQPGSSADVNVRITVGNVKEGAAYPAPMLRCVVAS